MAQLLLASVCFHSMNTVNNILFDLSVAVPNVGGINQVCRTFESKMTLDSSKYTCYALWPGERESRPEKVVFGDAGIARIDNYLDLMAVGNVEKGVDGRDRQQLRNRNYASLQIFRPLWWKLMSVQRRIQRNRDSYLLYKAGRQLEQDCRNLNIDIIHCPYQWINPLPPRHINSVSYISNMHDLQHEHFPEFFSDAEIRRRKTAWYASARACRFVVVAAEHVKRDIVRFIGIDPEKVVVIPWGPFFEDTIIPAASCIDAVRREFDLPLSFLLYPAITWPHKNHKRLIEAIALLRSRGIDVNCLLTGDKGSAFNSVMELVEKRGVSDLVRHIGFVDSKTMRILYELATGVVVPSLHEQTSIPVMEAMSLGCPVCAGSIADHSELLADNCGELFDPKDVADITRCVEFLWCKREQSAGMAINAKKRIRSIRNWGSWLSGYRELYDRCIEEKKV